MGKRACVFVCLFASEGILRRARRKWEREGEKEKERKRKREREKRAPFTCIFVFYEFRRKTEEKSKTTTKKKTHEGNMGSIMEEPTFMRIVLHVFGLRADIISTEFTRFSMPRPRGNCPYLTPQFIREGEQEPQRYAPPTVDQLRLALVSDAEEMGNWGTTAPLLLEKTRPSLNGNDMDANLLYFTASVKVPASSVKEHALRFRLVIVDEPLLSAIATMSTTASSSSGVSLCLTKGIRPGAAIVAVENAYWQPDTVTLVSSDTQDGKIWHAYIDLRDRVVHFSRASKQFPFLSQLCKDEKENSASKAGPLLSLTFYANDPRTRFERQAWLESLPPQRRDAMIYLQQEYRRQCNEDNMSGGEPLSPSSSFEVEDIYPVRCDGSCWCEGHLPTPAPMEKQNQVLKQATKRRQRRKEPENDKEVLLHNPHRHTPCMEPMEVESASVEPAADYASRNCLQCKQQLSQSSENTSFFCEDAITAVMRRGWCVEPLHSSDPVRPFSPGDPQFTMRVWHSTVNVAPLKERGLQIEAMMPIPIYDMNRRKDSLHSIKLAPSLTPTDSSSTIAFAECHQVNNTNDDERIEWNASNNSNETNTCSPSGFSTTVIGVRWVKGVAVLQPPLFKHHTSGTLAIPLCFMEIPEAGGSPVTYWHTIYVQYLFVFPFHYKQRCTLEVVRSLSSLGRLATKKPVGHRGLGKTYTRSMPIEASDEATSSSTAPRRVKPHRLTVKLAENSLESINAAHRRGCDMVEFDVMLTRDRIPVIFHDPLIQLQASKKRGAGTRNGRVERKVSNSLPSLDFGCSPVFMDNLHLYPQMNLSPHSPAFLASASPSFATFSERTPAQLLQLCMYSLPNFTSVPIALHQLTKRQLDVVTTETFTHMKDTNTLRNLILRHWNQILRVYRNRTRRRYLSIHEIQPPEGENDFASCLPNESDASCREHQKDDVYNKYLHHRQRILAQQEDVTNHICTLEDLFEGTPASLRFDLEVKFPFQPIGDKNLFLQIDAFEVNAFVDDILRVVFAYADQRQSVQDERGCVTERPRDVIFSSFEPDVCLALKMKQSRFDVVFLCDTEMSEDFKDYRCFGLVEGALQFSVFMHLSGVSILAASLCTREQMKIPSTRSISRLPRQPASLQAEIQQQEGRQKDIMDLRNGNYNSHANTRTDEDVTDRRSSSVDQREAEWALFDCSRGKAIAAYAHAHKQLIWTWGEMNNDAQFTYVQSKVFRIDAIITDNVPLWTSAQGVDTPNTTVST
ncbi:hypothetical protein MOQ_010067 [Trypanosoma cruzi marinkellei]|uniref:GP-PDE domain-containing protein n=1 Tax=Trypanosoma cruzi marinkellei TaxID=85056 RepID=K2MV30_TRYCR|nr:hypothetical protein MOQ_010067 [Trypanosoma cruzi marinkellei]